MRKRTRAREIILKTLYQIDLGEEDIREKIQTTLDFETIQDDEIRKYVERVAIGTLENVQFIDEVLNRYTDNWNLKRMAVIDRNILRFSTYELLFLEDIPPKVTINESINLAKKFSQEESGKFVNGILDKINHSEKKLYEPPLENINES